MTIFKSTLQKILGQELVFENREELIGAIIIKLPLEVTGSVSSNSTLYNLQK